MKNITTKIALLILVSFLSFSNGYAQEVDICAGNGYDAFQQFYTCADGNFLSFSFSSFPNGASFRVPLITGLTADAGAITQPSPSGLTVSYVNSGTDNYILITNGGADYTSTSPAIVPVLANGCVLLGPPSTASVDLFANNRSVAFTAKICGTNTVITTSSDFSPKPLTVPFINTVLGLTTTPQTFNGYSYPSQFDPQEDCYLYNEVKRYYVIKGIKGISNLFDLTINVPADAVLENVQAYNPFTGTFGNQGSVIGGTDFYSQDVTPVNATFCTVTNLGNSQTINFDATKISASAFNSTGTLTGNNYLSAGDYIVIEVTFKFMGTTCTNPHAGFTFKLDTYCGGITNKCAAVAVQPAAVECPVEIAGGGVFLNEPPPVLTASVTSPAVNFCNGPTGGNTFDISVKFTNHAEYGRFADTYNSSVLIDHISVPFDDRYFSLPETLYVDNTPIVTDAATIASYYNPGTKILTIPATAFVNATFSTVTPDYAATHTLTAGQTMLRPNFDDPAPAPGVNPPFVYFPSGVTTHDDSYFTLKLGGIGFYCKGNPAHATQGGLQDVNNSLIDQDYRLGTGNGALVSYDECHMCSKSSTAPLAQFSMGFANNFNGETFHCINGKADLSEGETSNMTFHYRNTPGTIPTDPLQMFVGGTPIFNSLNTTYYAVAHLSKHLSLSTSIGDIEINGTPLSSITGYAGYVYSHTYTDGSQDYYIDYGALIPAANVADVTIMVPVTLNCGNLADGEAKFGFETVKTDFRVRAGNCAGTFNTADCYRFLGACEDTVFRHCDGGCDGSGTMTAISDFSFQRNSFGWEDAAHYSACTAEYTLTTATTAGLELHNVYEYDHIDCEADGSFYNLNSFTTTSPFQDFTVSLQIAHSDPQVYQFNHGVFTFNIGGTDYYVTVTGADVVVPLAPASLSSQWGSGTTGSGLITNIKIPFGRLADDGVTDVYSLMSGQTGPFTVHFTGDFIVQDNSIGGLGADNYPDGQIRGEFTVNPEAGKSTGGKQTWPCDNWGDVMTFIKLVPQKLIDQVVLPSEIDNWQSAYNIVFPQTDQCDLRYILLEDVVGDLVDDFPNELRPYFSWPTGGVGSFTLTNNGNTYVLVGAQRIEASGSSYTFPSIPIGDFTPQGGNPNIIDFNIATADQWNLHDIGLYNRQGLILSFRRIVCTEENITSNHFSVNSSFDLEERAYGTTPTYGTCPSFQSAVNGNKTMPANLGYPVQVGSNSPVSTSTRTAHVTGNLSHRTTPTINWGSTIDYPWFYFYVPGNTGTMTNLHFYSDNTFSTEVFVNTAFCSGNMLTKSASGLYKLIRLGDCNLYFTFDFTYNDDYTCTTGLNIPVDVYYGYSCDYDSWNDLTYNSVDNTLSPSALCTNNPGDPYVIDITPANGSYISYTSNVYPSQDGNAAVTPPTTSACDQDHKLIEFVLTMTPEHTGDVIYNPIGIVRPLNGLTFDKADSYIKIAGRTGSPFAMATVPGVPQFGSTVNGMTLPPTVGVGSYWVAQDVVQFDNGNTDPLFINYGETIEFHLFYEPCDNFQSITNGVPTMVIGYNACNSLITHYFDNSGGVKSDIIDITDADLGSHLYCTSGACPSLDFDLTHTDAACSLHNGTAMVSNVTVTGGSSPFHYLWDVPGSPTTSSVSGLSAGTYHVTVYDSDGSASTTKTFTVTATNTTMQANVSTTPECGTSHNGTITITPSTGESPYTYSWAGGLPATSTQSGLAAGTYTVTVTDKNGCSGTATATVAHVTPPTVVLTPSSASICLGGGTNSVVITASGADTYTWDPSTSLSVSSDGTSATATPVSNITYTVIGTLNGTNGCSSSSTVVVTVNSQPTVTVNISDTVICLGNSVTLVPSGADTYSWDPSTGLTVSSDGSASASPTQTTTYTVTGTSNGCSSSTTVVVTVQDCCHSLDSLIVNVDYIKIDATNNNIHTSQTWHGRYFISTILNVYDDAILDLTNVDIMFAQNAGIVFHDNSYARVNNSVLRPCDVSGTWNGFTFQDYSAGIIDETLFKNASIGIHIESAGDVRIDNNNFSNDNVGIFIEADDEEYDEAITGNTFIINSNSPTYGGTYPFNYFAIKLYNTYVTGLISQNNFVDQYETAAADLDNVHYGVHAELSSFTASENTFSDMYRAFDVTNNTGPCNISDNTIEFTENFVGAHAAIYIWDCTNPYVTVERNKLTDNSDGFGYGLAVENSEFVNTVENAFNNFNRFSILCMNTNQLNILHNTIIDGISTGILLEDCEYSTTVDGNYVNMNSLLDATGIAYYLDDESSYDNTSVQITNNCVYNTFEAILLDGTSDEPAIPLIQGNYLYNYTYAGLEDDYFSGNIGSSCDVDYATLGLNTFISNYLPDLGSALDVLYVGSNGLNMYGNSPYPLVTSGSVYVDDGCSYSSIATCQSGASGNNSAFQQEQELEMVFPVTHTGSGYLLKNNYQETFKKVKFKYVYAVQLMNLLSHNSDFNQLNTLYGTLSNSSMLNPHQQQWLKYEYELFTKDYKSALSTISGITALNQDEADLITIEQMRLPYCESKGSVFSLLNNDTVTLSGIDNRRGLYADYAREMLQVIEGYHDVIMPKIPEVQHKSVNRLGINSFTVYPNPTSGEIKVLYSMKNDGMLKLTDITGRTLKEFNIPNNSGNLNLDISEFGSGVYLLWLISDKKHITTVKIIKE